MDMDGIMTFSPQGRLFDSPKKKPDKTKLLKMLTSQKNSEYRKRLKVIRKDHFNPKQYTQSINNLSSEY